MAIQLKGKSIGIDLGHCETTFSHPYLNGNNLEVISMRIDGRETIALTQVLLTNEQMQKLKGHLRPDWELLESLGEIRFGQLPASVENAEVFRYFKVSPEKFDEDCAKTQCGIDAEIKHGQVMACFSYAVLMSALEHATNVSPDEISQLTLYVGCPATGSWTEEKNRKEYAELLKTATGVKKVVIVPESRAALFSSLDNKRYKAISASSGVIVFDFGSSTADCTFIRIGKGVMEYSWTLGAHAIEENMVRLVLKQLYEKKGFFVPDEESLQSASDSCRKIKESYFKGEYGSDGYPAGFVFKNKAGEKKMEMTLIEDTFMKAAIHDEQISVTQDSGSKINGSWYELCRKFMEFARGEMKRCGFEASTIVLTGGASRMPFIADLCSEIFGADTRLIKETNPSLTVSNGLGTVAVVENNYNDCLQEAIEQVKTMPGCSIEELTKNIKTELNQKYVEQILLVADQWKNQKEDCSVADLIAMISEHMGSDEQNNSFTDCISQNIKEWKDNLGVQISDAVNAQANGLLSQQVAQSLMLDRELWKNLQASVIDVNVDVKELLGHIDLNTALRDAVQAAVILTSAIAGMSIGAEVGSAGGPVGAAIGGAAGAAVGAVAGVFGAAAFDDNDMKKLRDSKWRKRFVEKDLVKELKKPETAEKLTTAVDESMKKHAEHFNENLKRVIRRAMDIVTLRIFSI